MAALLKNYHHGGNAGALALALGRPLEEILDCSASINPLGPPGEVLEAARRALAAVQHYPEVEAASLRAALAQYHALPEECLLPGSGSTELIYLLPRVLQPHRALLVAPAFSEYERSLRQAGCAVDRVLWSPAVGFDQDLILRSLGEETDLLVLANPGNPSGALIPASGLRRLLDLLPRRLVLLLDEAFIDFCPEESLIAETAARPNLYVLRSLTKFYAIPGLRAGYLAGPGDGVARLADRREPWALSVPALAAAEACLRAGEFRSRTLLELPVLRAKLAAGLRSLGLEVFPSAANYLLLRLPPGVPDATAIAGRLAAKGILVRDCSNFFGLDRRFLRLAVRTDSEQQRLLQALAAVLEGEEGPC